MSQYDQDYENRQENYRTDNRQDEIRRDTFISEENKIEEEKLKKIIEDKSAKALAEGNVSGFALLNKLPFVEPGSPTSGDSSLYDLLFNRYKEKEQSVAQWQQALIFMIRTKINPSLIEEFVRLETLITSIMLTNKESKRSVDELESKSKNFIFVYSDLAYPFGEFFRECRDLQSQKDQLETLKPSQSTD